MYTSKVLNGNTILKVSLLFALLIILLCPINSHAYVIYVNPYQSGASFEPGFGFRPGFGFHAYPGPEYGPANVYQPYVGERHGYGTHLGYGAHYGLGYHYGYAHHIQPAYTETTAEHHYQDMGYHGFEHVIGGHRAK